MKKITFTFLLVLSATMQQPLNAQCDCPADTEAPAFSGDSLVVVNDCPDEAVPYLTVSDNCDPAPVVTIDQELLSSEYCGLHSTIDYNCNYSYPWSLILFNIPYEHRYYMSEDLGYRKYDDGTAHIYGTVYNPVHPNAKWELDVWLYDRLDWNSWSTQAFPTSYKADCGGLDAQHSSWYYYKVSSTSHATGIGDLEGSYLTFAHAPANMYFGFQEGDGANNLGPGPGIGGWITFSGFINNSATGFSMNVSGAGDIAGEMECCSSTETLYTYTATDICGNISTATQIVEVHNALPPVLVNSEPTPPVVTCDEYVAWMPVWNDDCGAVETGYLQHYPDIWFVAWDGCGNPSYAYHSQVILPPLDGDCPIYGCMNPLSPNYDPAAWLDDGSCFESSLPIVIFNDDNANGLMDIGESGISDITVLSSASISNYYTNVFGEVDVPYNTNSNFNEISIQYDGATWSATTPAEVSFQGSAPPGTIYFGLSGVVLTGNVMAEVFRGPLCGPGDHTFFMNVTNMDGAPTAAFNIEVTLPADATITSSSLTYTVNGQVVSFTSSGLAPGEISTGEFNLNLSGPSFEPDMIDELIFNINIPATANTYTSIVPVDCSPQAMESFTTSPVGIGAMRYIDPYAPVTYTYTYINDGGFVISDLLLGIYVDQSFDLSSAEILYAGRPYERVDDVQNRLIIINMENVGIAPGEEVQLIYRLMANVFTAGTPLPCFVVVNASGMDASSETITLHVVDCPDEVTIFTDAGVCAGSTAFSVTQDFFDDLSWTIDGNNVAWNDAFVHEFTTLGNHIVHVSASNDLCSADGNISIMIEGMQPEIALSNQDGTFCSGSSVSLNALTNMTPESVTWYLDGEPAGTGLDLEISSEAEVTVVATDPAGCGTAETIIQTEELPLAELELVYSGDTELCEGETIDVGVISNAEVTLMVDGSPASETGIMITGTSQVLATASNVCSTASETVDFTFHPLPVVVIEFDASQGTAFATPGFEYQWYLNGEPLPGANESTLAISATGNYSVAATNIQGCVGMSEELLIDLAIDENVISGALVYPNPASDAFTVVFDKPEFLIIKDMQGKVVYMSGQQKAIHALDHTQIAAGVYAIFAGGQSVGRVVLR